MQHAWATKYSDEFAGASSIVADGNDVAQWTTADDMKIIEDINQIIGCAASREDNNAFLPRWAGRWLTACRSRGNVDPESRCSGCLHDVGRVSGHQPKSGMLQGDLDVREGCNTEQQLERGNVSGIYMSTRSEDTSAMGKNDR